MTVTLRHRLEFALARAIESLVSVFPRPSVVAFGELLGQVFYWVDARHRNVALENLRRAELGLSEAEIKATAQACFRHFGAMFLSNVALGAASSEDLESWVQLEGLEHFDAARAGGKGFIQLTGHYGDWEALALAQSLAGRDLSVIARELDNPLLEPWMQGFRTRFGNRVITKDGGARGALKAFRKGDGVGYLLDQDALGMGLFVPFLGRWASTFASAGTMAVRLGVPVLPVFSWPTPEGKVKVRFQSPFTVEPTGDEARDVWEATRRMVGCIEAQIRQDPRWWFWMHNRFKTSPGNPGSPTLPPVAWLEGIPNLPQEPR
ncbi:MAG TPA: lysophospholipid acyltransferase family protein [Holophagaceae bacterium]|nr:lysophospholipid acyltransferase family protein [Holophagaceae bacterium]